MPICHQNRFIFFHIPRCAGTSIERAFGLTTSNHLYGVMNSGDQVLSLQHFTPTDLKQSGLITDQVIEEYFKFTVIRDPFDRMASDYLWQQKKDAHQLFSCMSFGEYLDFALQIMESGAYFHKRHFDHFRPMINYCTEGDSFLLDDILLLENLDAELRRIAPHLGRQPDLDKLNSSSNYEHLRTKSNLERVYELYAADKALYDHLVSVNKQS